MTIAALLALALQSALPLVPPSPTAPAPLDAPPLPPSSDTWDILPPLQVGRAGIDMAPLVRFVRGEVAAGRCLAATVSADGTTSLRAPVAVLVDPSGGVRRLVPAAIGCSTVEQFTAGVIARFAAANLRPPWPDAARWYRSGLTYSWSADTPLPPAR